MANPQASYATRAALFDSIEWLWETARVVGWPSTAGQMTGINKQHSSYFLMLSHAHCMEEENQLTFHQNRLDGPSPSSLLLSSV